MPLQPASKSDAAELRYRKNVTALSGDELNTLRSAFLKMEEIQDDRGYEYWAGIHGLPLPISCVHHLPLFLPWHRAYLYYFEQYLLDAMPNGTSVALPWWDWSTQAGIPQSYETPTLPDGTKNPLAGAPISGIPDSQFTGTNITKVTETSRDPGPVGAGLGPTVGLPSSKDVEAVLKLDDFADFTHQLEGLHDHVHTWVGGTMAEIPLAAFDPLFWAHHTMIDRLWSLWQQSHPGAGIGSISLDAPLGPFPTLNVGQVLRIEALGYQYAATANSATPT